MNRNRMNLRIFDNDTNIIDRTGAESLIPIQESNEIIQGVVTQSAVLQRGRKLPNMTSRQYKMPVLDMLPIAYFVNGDTGQKKTTKQAWDKKFITAEEIAVITLKDEADVAELMESLHTHLKNRKGTMQAYAPDQVSMLEDAVITYKKNCVVLIVSEKSGVVQRAFESYFK